ncbi:NADPH dehydrogenase NamA [Niallia endozanthoxylica]|uniref:NADPH dehydrogenase n=1 Tax=Niallia endozanthoxylica TaxID=2036016 RepID=A0A5J5HYU4_9BACI|nr:NADPH dehydrogenase NamA [Niallia endozanthoxylica]KAA9026212.1 NADPH dehydrogenase NamA [Niallia endozanthoxylica]
MANTKLFSPYTLKNVTLKNRIVMAPMCMYSCTNQDGKVTPWHYTHYISRAVGQTGLLIQEATAVSPEGRISPYDLGIWDDEHIEGLLQLTTLIKENGAKTGIQLGHAGRKAVLDGEILAPSAIPFDEQSKTPKEMTKEDIHGAVTAFKKAAERAKKAGFDVIEIHGAHGYLINQFLSPLSNHRSDEYGGSPQNRYRFLKEVIEAVKSAWDGPLFVRVSATEYHPEGLTVEDYVEYSRWMKEQGVDLIDVSSGAIVPAAINIYPGYQVPLAEKIRHGAEIPTGAVGLITSGLQAEEILQSERADLILLARELLRDPYWSRRAAQELDVEIESPVQYERGWKQRRNQR